jgi:hypothetical protein
MADELVAYFWEREDADAVASALDGEVRRERFHGEDDDEDHPWVVVLPASTEAAALEQVVGAHDGWLTAPEPDQPVTEAPSLPDAPRRFKNPPS